MNYETGLPSFSGAGHLTREVPLVFAEWKLSVAFLRRTDTSYITGCRDEGSGL